MFHRLTIALALIGAVALVGCDDPEDSGADEDGEQVELTFAFQPQENPEGMRLDTENFAEFMTDQTGYDVEIFLPTHYSAVVEALRAGNADVAYFSGLPYMMAHEEAGAELLVVEEREGEPFYQSQWYTLEKHDVEELADLEDRPVAFTSPTSTSGYLFPLAEAMEQGLVKKGGSAEEFFGDVVFSGGYQQALMALVNGQVEAAAASDYALQQYLSEEQRDSIRVITEQGPVPTHGLAIRGELDDEIKQNVRDALLKLNDEEHAELLESIYGAERLVEQDHDEHVQALDRAWELVDFDGEI